MKAIKLFVLSIILVVCTSKSFAQRGKHGGGHHPHKGRNHVVAKRSIYRPHKVIVYHPYWRPKYAYNRRWVYFPKYNLYWDNWRNHYVFWNGTIWLSQATAPPVIVNVNLENEKNVELKEDEDDVDDVYKDNTKHKEDVKPD
jgi:hypothetical protein